MLQPTNRLILFAAVLAPLTLFAALSQGLLILIVGIYGVFLAIAVLDAWASRKTLTGVTLSSSPTVRLSKDNAGQIELFLHNKTGQAFILTLGLPLPPQLETEDSQKHIQLTAEDKTWLVTWPCTAQERGIYPLKKVFSETTSRLGLWSLRRPFAVDTEIRVYPNLRREQRKLANLFLNRGLSGMHQQRMVGKGREYERLRDYAPGDSVLDLHWKASAKRNSLVTKTYQVERTQEIYLLVDNSRLIGRVLPDSRDTVLERFVTAASVLGLAAEKQGDLFGLVTFGHQIHRFVRASSGKQHQQVVQDALFSLKPERVVPDYDELFTFIRTRMRRRALLIILTDLGDPVVAEAFRQRVTLATGQHHIIVNMLEEPGVAPLFQADSAPESTLELYQNLAGHMRWHELKEEQRLLKSKGVTLNFLPEEQLAVDVVNQYIAIKQRQVL